MLIPVYVVGFILGGLVLFAIAQRVPNRTVKIWLRAIAILAGPIFFLAVAIFSSWERERTYEMEWLIGRTAMEYLGSDKYDNHGANNLPATNPLTKKQEDLVALRRNIGNNRECYAAFSSDALAHYLESLPVGRVKVRYRVIYDFYLPRTYMLESIGDFRWLQGGEIGLIVGGKSDFQNAMNSCLSWSEKGSNKKGSQ